MLDKGANIGLSPLLPVITWVVHRPHFRYLLARNNSGDENMFRRLLVGMFIWLTSCGQSDRCLDRVRLVMSDQRTPILGCRSEEQKTDDAIGGGRVIYMGSIAIWMSLDGYICSCL